MENRYADYFFIASSISRVVVHPLAGQSGDSGAVRNFRKICSSVAKAAEHVGKKIDGVGR